jgi:hypothetical protein
LAEFRRLETVLMGKAETVEIYEVLLKGYLV